MWKSDIGPTSEALDWKVSVKVAKHSKYQTAVSKRPPAFGFDGSENEAEDHLRGAALKQASTLTSQGLALIEGGDPIEAVKKFDQGIFYSPRDASLHEMRAQALNMVGRSWDAVKASQIAVDLRSEWPEAYATLARCQANLGEIGLAVETAERAIKLGLSDPSDIQAEIDVWSTLLTRKIADPDLVGRRVPVVDNKPKVDLETVPPVSGVPPPGEPSL